MKQQKSIIRSINEIKVYLRYMYYGLCKSIGIFKILYPNIKQPYKRWYDNRF